MIVDALVKEQVLSTVETFFKAFAKRDLDTLMGLFLPDDDVVLIGTESDERLVGLHAISQRFQSDWSRTDEMSMEMGWHSVSGKGDVCWLGAEVLVNVSAEGNRLQIPARITIVLERRSGRWLIAQWHASIPME